MHEISAEGTQNGHSANWALRPQESRFQKDSALAWASSLLLAEVCSTKKRCADFTACDASNKLQSMNKAAAADLRDRVGLGPLHQEGGAQAKGQPKEHAGRKEVEELDEHCDHQPSMQVIVVHCSQLLQHPISFKEIHCMPLHARLLQMGQATFLLKQHTNKTNFSLLPGLPQAIQDISTQAVCFTSTLPLDSTPW